MRFNISTNVCLYQTSQRKKPKVPFTFNVDSYTIWANAVREEQASGATDGLELQLWYHIVILITNYF